MPLPRRTAMRLPDEGQTETDLAELVKNGVRTVACQGVDMGGTHAAAIKLIGLTTVQTIVWMDVHGLNAAQELVRLLPMHKSVVPTKDSEGCPPEVVFRSPHRNKSEEDANASRAEEIRCLCCVAA